MLKYKVIAEKVTGAKHKKSGINQDYYKYEKYGVNKELLVIAVADGHGSEKCKYSDIGAREAVAAFHNSLVTSYKSYSDEDAFYADLSRYKEDKMPEKIIKDWKNSIEEFHKKHHADETFDSLLYGTTLLGLMIHRKFVYIFQLGDGDILEVRSDGVTQRVIEIPKILGTETNSMSQKDAWTKVYAKTRYISEENQTPMLFLLSTDGLANSYKTDESFLRIGGDYLSIIREHGLYKVKDNLKKWLNEITSSGSGDDITLCIVFDDEIGDKGKR